MEDKDKEKIIRQWFSDNWEQLQINAWKTSGKQQHVYEKWYKDALVHVVEEFLRRDIDKQWKVFTDGKFENYMTRAMAIAVKSGTSSFYHRYRKKERSGRELLPEYDYGLYHHDAEEEELKREHISDRIKEAIEELDFYDKYLITQYYFNNLSSKEIGEIVDIQPSVIVRDIRKILQKLHDKLEDTIL